MKYSKELHQNILCAFKDSESDNNIGVTDGIVKVLLDEIERLQSERRWIPVSERLPEMYTPVLTMSKRAKHPRILSREKAEKEWEWSLRQLSGYVAYINQNNVTHWMPLPEPPEEE